MLTDHQKLSLKVDLNTAKDHVNDVYNRMIQDHHSLTTLCGGAIAQFESVLNTKENRLPFGTFLELFFSVLPVVGQAGKALSTLTALAEFYRRHKTTIKAIKEDLEKADKIFNAAGKLSKTKEQLRGWAEPNVEEFTVLTRDHWGVWASSVHNQLQRTQDLLKGRLELEHNMIFFGFSDFAEGKLKRMAQSIGGPIPTQDDDQELKRRADAFELKLYETYFRHKAKIVYVDHVAIYGLPAYVSRTTEDVPGPVLARLKVISVHRDPFVTLGLWGVKVERRTDARTSSKPY